MKLIALTLCILLFLSASSINGQTSDWRTLASDIELLKDTYDDVVNKLGPPADGPEKSPGKYFDFPDSRINELFASGKCVEASYSRGKLID